MDDTAYRCEFCGHWSVVPSLNTEHQARCAANPDPLNHETGHRQPPQPPTRGNA